MSGISVMTGQDMTSGARRHPPTRIDWPGCVAASAAGASAAFVTGAPSMSLGRSVESDTIMVDVSRSPQTTYDSDWSRYAPVICQQPPDGRSSETIIDVPSSRLRALTAADPVTDCPPPRRPAETEIEGEGSSVIDQRSLYQNVRMNRPPVVDVPLLHEPDVGIVVHKAGWPYGVRKPGKRKVAVCEASGAESTCNVTGHEAGGIEGSEDAAIGSTAGVGRTAGVWDSGIAGRPPTTVR